MSLLVYLLGGREIRLGIGLDEWTEAFNRALANNEAIQIEPSEGGKGGISPRAVLYWKVEDGQSSLDFSEPR
jgi:hypothetical protein